MLILPIAIITIAHQYHNNGFHLGHEKDGHHLGSADGHHGFWVHGGAEPWKSGHALDVGQAGVIMTFQRK